MISLGTPTSGGRFATVLAALLCGTLLALLPSTATSAPLVIEEFDYPDGSLSGNNEGTGFSNAWGNGGWSVQNGNATISATSETANTRTLATPITGTFYFSFVLTTDAYSATTAAFSDYLRFRASGGSTLFHVGSDKPGAFDYRLQATMPGSQTLRLSDNVVNPQGTSSTIVGKYVFDDGTGNAILTLWLNPAGDEGASVSVSRTWASSLTELASITLVRYGAGADATQSFDSIRIGADWESVTTVIPEPATYATIIALTGLAAATMSRKRRR